jgi:hypothetical protein
VSRTKRISFIKATIHDPDGLILAMGQGSYRLIKGTII